MRANASRAGLSASVETPQHALRRAKVAHHVPVLSQRRRQAVHAVRHRAHLPLAVHAVASVDANRARWVFNESFFNLGVIGNG